MKQTEFSATKNNFMASNDQIILRRILEEQKQEGSLGVSPDKDFEVFVAEQVTKDFDLSYDEIIAGVLGDSRDGGIDSIYCLINGDLVREDTDASTVKRSALVELYLTQAKTHVGFGEYAIEKFRSMATDLLDLSHDLSDFKSSYADEILVSLARFREIYQTLVAKSRSLRSCLHMPVWATRAILTQKLNVRLNNCQSRCRGCSRGVNSRSAFLALLDADPEPTEAAKRAAAEYKKGRHVGGKYYFTLISNLPTSI